MLTVKRLYGLSYEQTEYQVRDSLVLRQFCRVYFEDVPDDTTLIRWANLITAETLAAYNQRVTQLATELKVTTRAQAAHGWDGGGEQHPCTQ